MIRTAKQAGLEWEGAGLPEAPSAPDSLQESGLPLGFGLGRTLTITAQTGKQNETD